MNLDKIVNPGSGRDGHVYCRIQYDGTRLSISGVVGPKPNGDARGACGQIVDQLADDVATFATGWDAAALARFAETWRRWHLNDARPGCEHQRDGYGADVLDVVSYKLTTDAYHVRSAALAKAARAAALDKPAGLTDVEVALILLDDWFRPRFTPPDADSPLSGCYEVEKRERKTAGWVTPAEHPAGVLTKPCAVCGYKYGTRWLLEAVPDAVVAYLAELPESRLTPAWV